MRFDKFPLNFEVFWFLSLRKKPENIPVLPWRGWRGWRSKWTCQIRPDPSPAGRTACCTFTKFFTKIENLKQNRQLLFQNFKSEV